MKLILVKNPDIKKITNNFFKTDSWSILPGMVDDDIDNYINYTKLTDESIEFFKKNDIIGYDLEQKIYLTFKHSTIIKEYNDNIETINNKLNKYRSIVKNK